ncbi:sterol-binding protein [Neofusicoccum ribis]|uniref:Sterol-binding protein n=1 Tax=Neofusicoccum ribis TaxID=45134 RepID=A0ABR3SQJ3_9PEZI
MRSATAIALSLATLAAASPLDRRATGSSMPAWVCNYFPDYCSGSSSSSSSGSSTTVTEASTDSGTSGSTGSTTTTTAAAAATTTASTSSGTNEWVTLHNDYRAKHVDTNGLTWDADLAAGALEHSKKCVFEHSTGGDYGENLAMGSGLTAKQTVDMWYAEIDDYGSYWGKDDVPMSVMHFTQVVWKGTTKVGCGTYECSDGVLATCRYAPAGNYLGEFAANVGELKSSS